MFSIFEYKYRVANGQTGAVNFRIDSEVDENYN